MTANINFLESVSIAAKSLRSNKLRSFLTLLGIIIGVTTVITVITIIQGLNRYVKYQVLAFGSNSFSVKRIAEMTFNLKTFQEMMKRKRLSYDTYLYLKANAKMPLLVEAEYNAQINVKYMNRSISSVQLNGETAQNYLTGRTLEMNLGRMLSIEDERYGRPVCVIGQDVMNELFPYGNPIGKWIQGGARRYRVIGVVNPMGKILGFSLDTFIKIPITTFQKDFAARFRSITINVKAKNLENIESAKEEIRTLLRGYRKLAFTKDDDFSIEDAQTFLDFYNNLTRILFIAMIIIASISMVVGGIVIMNIMLVSVTERTAEIGLRKAVGARRKDILLQFLIESSSISAIGGIIGIIIGFSFAKAISAMTQLPASIELWSIVLAIVMSSSIGLFFGIYPANRAAKYDPVVALRSSE